MNDSAPDMDALFAPNAHQANQDSIAGTQPAPANPIAGTQPAPPPEPRPLEYDKRTVLTALEHIMLFDQSEPSKWPRITIHIEAGGADQFQEEQHVQVFPNGRVYNIERSADAPVPPEVVDALHQCMTARMVKEPNAPNSYVSRDVMRWPFRVVDPASQIRYDAWKKALDILRVTITETKKETLQTGKVIYTTTDRYIPEERLVEAVAMVRWANSENARQKAKEASLRAAAA